MGNAPPTSSSKRRSSRKGSSNHSEPDEDHHQTNGGSTSNDVAARASRVMGDVQAGLASSMKKLEEHDNPVAGLLDTVCGAYLGSGGDPRRSGMRSYYSDEQSEYSEGETTITRRDEATVDDSYVSTQSTEYDDSTVPETTSRRNSKSRRGGRHDESSYDTEDDDTYTQPSRVTTATSVEGAEPHREIEPSTAAMLARQPLASAFAKRCYFTKAGIGGHTQHYEGLTLTGNVVLMLAQAMKLKGCPTICDEDLRRVEQTYPNQFSRLPDELLLSSGWRRISKYCHFSHKPIPDGIPFFRMYKYSCVFALFLWFCC